MVSRQVAVVNRLGVHARAAAKFVHLATRYQAQVRVKRDGRQVDGKSIMGILLLAAAKGAVITISADGIDEADLAGELQGMIEDRQAGPGDQTRLFRAHGSRREEGQRSSGARFSPACQRALHTFLACGLYCLPCCPL